MVLTETPISEAISGIVTFGFTLIISLIFTLVFSLVFTLISSFSESTSFRERLVLSQPKSGKHRISHREEAIKKKALEIPENRLPLSAVQGSPSGLRPPVNP